MPINGVQTAVFGVDDLEHCDRFFTDFGLKVASKSETSITYRLPEGSYVVLKQSGDASLPPAYSSGPGIREVIWGVDSQNTLDGIEADLKKDRLVAKDPDGTLHTTDDLGLGIGFRLFERQPLVPKRELPHSQIGMHRGGHRPKKIIGAHRDWLLKRCRGGDFTLRGPVAFGRSRASSTDRRGRADAQAIASLIALVARGSDDNNAVVITAPGGSPAP